MLPGRLQEIVDDLLLFPDRQERIEALLSLADEFKGSPAAEVPRDAEHRVPACESEVYVTSDALSDGTRRYSFAVDNPQGVSAMALARILDQGLSGVPNAQVAQVPDDLVYTIFGNELSMGKSAGLMGMLQKVRWEAGRG